MEAIVMTNLIMKTSAVVLLAALAPSAASAAAGNASGSSALALAAVVAQHSTVLSASDKKTVASLFDGNTKTRSKPLTVAADSVQCQVNNVDITWRRCEMTFKPGKSGKSSVKGRAANEIDATLALAGVDAEGAAGSFYRRLTKLNCTLDPVEIKKKDGGGAKCSFRVGE
jgi:hypothetical protein